MNSNRTERDRFCSVVSACHDLFVDGLGNADREIAKKCPIFFRETIRDLRDTLCAHAPEAAKPAQWVAANIKKRDGRLREISGKVPVTEAEWKAARHELLRKAAAEALVFRGLIESDEG